MQNSEIQTIENYLSLHKEMISEMDYLNQSDYMMTEEEIVKAQDGIDEKNNLINKLRKLFTNEMFKALTSGFNHNSNMNFAQFTR